MFCLFVFSSHTTHHNWHNRIQTWLIFCVVIGLSYHKAGCFTVLSPCSRDCDQCVSSRLSLYAKAFILNLCLKLKLWVIVVSFIQELCACTFFHWYSFYMDRWIADARLGCVYIGDMWFVVILYCLVCLCFFKCIFMFMFCCWHS